MATPAGIAVTTKCLRNLACSVVLVLATTPAFAMDMVRNGAAASSPTEAARNLLPTGTRVLRDVVYGDHPRQRFDAYLPHGARGAPMLVLVHGGGWAYGDKDHPGLVGDKALHWVSQGYALVSVNYRLVPEASPVEQAQDIARAVAAAQGSATSWGIDPRRVVLMGHSAGAHLVALLAASPVLLAEAGARPVRGAVLLDSAAYDVAHVMDGPHPPLYDRAFGADPAAWRAASPYQRLSRQAVPMLAVCSTGRVRAACAQARAFRAKAATLGVRVDVLPQALSHMQINRLLGQPSAYTRRVDAFVRDVLR
jgi:arylformamidase